MQRFSSQFAAIRPNQSQTVTLLEKQGTFQIDLPEALRNRNVLVEIIAAGQTKSQAYYANSLKVQLIENYGQLQVAAEEDAKPAAGVYVKVYARMKDGGVRFYKDGYTDLRGRFDYTSLSTNEIDFVDRFALLIMSPDCGALVREAQPPSADPRVGGFPAHTRDPSVGGAFRAPHQRPECRQGFPSPAPETRV